MKTVTTMVFNDKNYKLRSKDVFSLVCFQVVSSGKHKTCPFCQENLEDKTCWIMEVLFTKFMKLPMENICLLVPWNHSFSVTYLKVYIYHK